MSWSVAIAMLATNRTTVPPVLNLPLPLPSSGAAGLDRLGGLVLGAVLFLLARRPARWIIGLFRA